MPTITIVANTGFRIDTRVIHMILLLAARQPATCVVPEVGAHAAGGPAAAALTIAGAPSFRLSNFAPSTADPAGSAVLISTRPAASSRAPVPTLRLASLLSSTIQTNACPPSTRTAVAGSVGRGGLDASAILPVANIPPRSTL